MPITNPQAVRFSNEYARTRADSLARFYYLAKELLDEYDATGMVGEFNGANLGETVEDGSAVDGRTPVTGQDVINLVDVYLRPWAADLEANGNTKLNILLKIAVTAGN
jgi:hypothetical protein